MRKLKLNQYPKITEIISLKIFRWVGKKWRTKNNFIHFQFWKLLPNKSKQIHSSYNPFLVCYLMLADLKHFAGHFSYVSIIQYNVELGAMRSSGAEADNYWILKSNLCSGLSSGGWMMMISSLSAVTFITFITMRSQSSSQLPDNTSPQPWALTQTQTNWPHYSLQDMPGLRPFQAVMVLMAYCYANHQEHSSQNLPGRWSLKCNDWLWALPSKFNKFSPSDICL